MKSGEVLRLLQITRPTLCRWVREGKIKAKKISRTKLVYDDDSVFELAGIKNRFDAVIYARVSKQDQESDLENQINSITTYADENGFKIDKIYKDIGSSLNFDREGFQNMLMDIVQYKIKTIFIVDKDRLSRVSFKLLKELFSYFSCEIVVLNNIESPNESNDSEIFEDLSSSVSYFIKKVSTKQNKNILDSVHKNLKIE
jgi:putative resolvase